MANEIDLHLNIQNSLNQTLKETQVTMKSFNSLLEQSAKNLTNASQSTQIINDKFRDIEKNTDKSSKNTSIFAKTLDKAKTAILGFVTPGLLIGIVKDAFKLGTAMKDLSFRMGEGGRTAGQLQEATMHVAETVGISVEKAIALTTALRGLRVATKDIQMLGTATAQYSEVTGVSLENASRLTGELVRSGKLSAISSKQMLSAMASMQRAVGMTEGEMEQINETLIKTTRVLSQYGKTAGQIETFNKGVVKLAGSFASVGVSAEKAANIIEDLLDPTNIEKNALLYAKMGVSISDVISGNIDPNQLSAGLKKVGQEIKGMGYAGNVLAQQMGSTGAEMRAFADMDLSKGAGGVEDIGKQFEEQLSPEKKFQKALMEIKNVLTEIVSVFTSSGLMEQLSSFAKSLAGKLPSLADKLIAFVKTIANPAMWVLGIMAIIGVMGLIKKKFKTVATDFKEDLVTAVSSGITLGAQKAQTTAMIAPPTAARGNAATANSRVTAGGQFKDIQDSAKTFDTMAKSNLFPAIARMTQNTAKWLRDTSYGAKEVSGLAIRTAENNKLIQDRIGFAREERNLIAGRMQDVVTEKNAQLGSYKDRIKALQTMEQERGKLTGKQQWELKQLTKLAEKNENDILKAKQKTFHEDERMNKRVESQLRAMHVEELKAMQENLGGKKQEIEAAMKGGEARKMDIADSQKLLQNRRLMIADEASGLEKKLKSKSITEEEYKRYQDISKELVEISQKEEGLKRDAADITKATEEQKTALTKVEGEMAKIEKVAKSKGEQVKTERDILNATRDRVQAESVITNKRLTQIADSREALNISIKEKQEKMKGLDKESKEYKKIQAELKYIQRQKIGLSKEEDELVKKTRKEGAEIDKIEKDIKKLGRGAGKSIIDVDTPMLKGKFTKLGEFAGSVFRKAGSSVSEGLDKAKNSIAQLGKDLAQRLNPGNILRGIRAGRGGGAGGEAAARAAGNSGAGTAGAGTAGAGRAPRRRRSGGGGLLGILKKLGIPLLIMGAIMPAFAGIMEQVKGSLATLGPKFKEVADKLTPVIQKLIPVLIGMVTSLIPVILKLVDLLVPPIIRIIKMLVPALVNLMNTLVPAIMELLDMLVPVMMDLIETLVPVILNLIQSLVPVLLSIIKLIVPPIVNLVKAIFPVIITLINALMPMIMGLVKALLPPLLKVLGAAVWIIGKLVQGVGELVKFIMELPFRIGQVFQFGKSQKTKDAELKAFQENLKQKNLVYKLADTISTLGGTIAEAGKAMMESKIEFETAANTANIDKFTTMPEMPVTGAAAGGGTESGGGATGAVFETDAYGNLTKKAGTPAAATPAQQTAEASKDTAESTAITAAATTTNVTLTSRMVDLLVSINANLEAQILLFNEQRAEQKTEKVSFTTNFDEYIDSKIKGAETGGTTSFSPGTYSSRFNVSESSARATAKAARAEGIILDAGGKD